MDRSLTFKGYT